jgi:hypothetical protein
MLHLTDASPAIRQNLATGRLSERVTGRALPASSATLSWRAGAGPLRPLKAVFSQRAEGYFTFSLLPDRDMPDVAEEDEVTLQASFSIGAAAPLVAEATVQGSVLAIEDRTRTVAGKSVTVRVVAGAPLDLSAAIDPTAIALQGMVIRAHDPAEPIAGVTVAAGPQSTITGSDGRFFLPALPREQEIVLELTEGVTTTELPFRIDYSRPVNSATLSLPD